MRPLALKCAESGCMQAVALLGRLGPVFPAARRREPTYEGECVFPAPRGERSERSVLLWMSEIRSKESHQYRLLPFKSLSSRPSQELGGCLNEVKAGGFSNGLSTRLCKIPIKKSALPQQRHLPDHPDHPDRPEISKKNLSGHVVLRLIPKTEAVSTRII